MDPNAISNLVDEYNKLNDLRNAEQAGLWNQKREIEGQIENINEKYIDNILEIEAQLGHLLYIAKYNKTELEMIFKLKEVAETNYELPDDYLHGFYEGMQEICSMFLSKEHIEEIDSKAQAKFPKRFLR